MVAALAVLTALTVATPAAITVRELLQPAPAGFATAAERAHAPSGGCLPRTTDNDDLRNGVYLQAWHQVAMCRNDAMAPLYLVPSTGGESPVVGRLRTGGADDLSWFLCWITGVPDHGAGSVYYYTTADDWAPGMEYRHGWGFVPAAYLAIGDDHARSGLPECPPVPGW
jgi:hypothetical protein